MIISASRRTDIPAFYSPWFFNRLKAGSVYVRNPMNRKQVSKITLTPDVVDCIVFWSKNPKPMLEKLDLLEGYNYYFQYTITPYGKDIQKNVPNVSRSVETFKRLSHRIGSEKVIWRYDPIFYTDTFLLKDHEKAFEDVASKISGYTEKCVISFLDVYKKSARNMKPIAFQPIDPPEMIDIAGTLARISHQHGIAMETCAEEVDLSELGILKGKCIDDGLISRIAQKKIFAKKDKNQRLACGCVASIDIGTYNSCRHNCLYCYANYDFKAVLDSVSQHDLESGLLCGHLLGDEKITARKMTSLFEKPRKEHQIRLPFNL